MLPRCRTPLPVLLVALLPISACSTDSATAKAVLERFLEALRAGDQEQCRQLVTRESRPALPELPWHELAQKQPLIVRGARPRHLGYDIEVEDPNAGHRRGQFVVVPERGRYVVDLVATAGLTLEERVGESAQDVVRPRELTPADLDRIRQVELAQPPR